MNTRFSYMYRDGSNWKNSGEVVFSGLVPNAENSIRQALDSREHFIASQIRVPEVFLWDPEADYPSGASVPVAQPGQTGHYRIGEDDHCWHELFSIEETEDEPTDEHSRTFDEFLAEIKAASAAGWGIFDPAERQAA